MHGHRSYPCKLFSLLSRPDLSESIVSDPECMKDSYTQHMQARFPTLSGAEFPILPSSSGLAAGCRHCLGRGEACVSPQARGDAVSADLEGRILKDQCRVASPKLQGQQTFGEEKQREGTSLTRPPRQVQL